MENLETLTTTIKLIAGESGGTASDATALSSSVATGDLVFMMLAVFILVCGACAIGITVFKRKQATVGAHALPNRSSRLTIPIISAITIILALCVALIGVGQNKALAAQNGTLSGGEQVVGTVDMQTGATTFADVIITNNSDYPEEIEKFAMSAVTGVDVSSVTWKIMIGETIVYNNQKLGEEGKFEAFSINGKSQMTMHVEAEGLTPELAKSLVGKDIASSGAEHKPADLYYAGSVQSPVDVSGKVTDKGLEGATVTFTSATNNDEITTTTDANGDYTLGVKVGAEGTISVTKTASDSTGDYGYSTDSFTVDTTQAKQTTAHVGKIQSLAVKVYQYSMGGYSGLKDTYWCPAFIDSSISQNDIKFYKSDHSTLITGTGTATPEGVKTYKLADMYNATDKMVAQYFAICKAGKTLKCYQTADKKWNDTFKFNSEPSSWDNPATADSLVDGWNSDGSICQDPSTGQPTGQTVYFNSTDSECWAPTTGTVPSGEPTLNSLGYNSWYYAYGGSSSDVLTTYSIWPWSAVAFSNNHAYFWNVSSKNWAHSSTRLDILGVVLSQAFIS